MTHWTINRLTWLWLKIKILHLFDSNSNRPAKQQSENHTTRLCIIFLANAFIIILSYTIDIEETKICTIEKPLQETYEKLYAKYPSSIACTCNEISIPYSVFITSRASSWKIFKFIITKFLYLGLFSIARTRFSQISI